MRFREPGDRWGSPSHTIQSAWIRLFTPDPATAAAFPRFRLVFFALLALDCILAVIEAPRYGAGSFNVAHFEFLDRLLPLPMRESMVACYLIQAYLALRIGLGLVSRMRRAYHLVLTLLYGYTYFISQTDSYQHHYLIFLLLVLMCFLPESDESPGAVPRLILLQVSIVYIWTAIAKCDPVWLSGGPLNSLIHQPAAREAIEWLGLIFPGLAGGGWSVAATLVLFGELLACAADPLTPRAHPDLHRRCDIPRECRAVRLSHRTL